MGFGDEIMATGMARGAKDRGKRIAFGDGKEILWGPWAEPIFRGNPNVARPGDEGARDLEWIAHYKGHRLYNRSDGVRWIWNMEFSPQPGEMFFTRDELSFAESVGSAFVVMEPNVPWNKTVAPNKNWGANRYGAVSSRLLIDGFDVVQFVYKRMRVRLTGVRQVATPSFRHALATLARAALYIGPEGGLHHGAAAVGIPAVVLFGGFIPPEVTGYPTHTNLTGNSVKACGKLRPCNHCRVAMDSISVDKVLKWARRHLAAKAVA